MADVTSKADLQGKVIVVTGGTTGIGKATVLKLVELSPAKLFFTGRNRTSAESVISEAKAASPTIDITFVEADLASLATVKTAAEDILTKSSGKVDILICNAGIMAVPLALTKDGYETQFGTNHLGHALFIKSFLPAIQQSPEGRIIILTSTGAALAPTGGILFDKLKTVQDCGFGGPWIRYGQSKLANILYARQLAKEYPSITSVSIHPGVINTGLIGGAGWLNALLVKITHPLGLDTVEEGAKNSLWATTTEKGNIENGGYYEPVGKIGKGIKYSKDDELAQRLWDWTDEQLKGF